MMDYPPVAGASQVEDDTDEKTRDALIEAGYALAEAMLDPEEWPAALRDRARRMIERLRTKGSIPNTVQAMDSRTVIELVLDIKILAADIEVARIQGLVRSLGQPTALSVEGDW